VDHKRETAGNKNAKNRRDHKKTYRRQKAGNVTPKGVNLSKADLVSLVEDIALSQPQIRRNSIFAEGSL